MKNCYAHKKLLKLKLNYYFSINILKYLYVYSHINLVFEIVGKRIVEKSSQDILHNVSLCAVQNKVSHTGLGRHEHYVKRLLEYILQEKHYFSLST